MRFKVLTPFPCAADGIHTVDLAEGSEVELTDAGTIDGLVAAGMIEAIEDVAPEAEPEPEPAPPAKKSGKSRG